MPARTGIWLARNGQLPARIELSSHGTENGRTERLFSARKGKLSAQIDFEAAGNDFCPHEVLADGHRLIFGSRGRYTLASRRDVA
ncbi:MAG TPA: hypothetical protein VE344_07075 [Methylomirabilota bacterium]|nr:hypothetical protein [Methylomirabilota bacterium]